MEDGFTAGVLHVTWLCGSAPIEIQGRPGLLYPAQITECHTVDETLPRDAVNVALVGLVVRAPDADATLSRIAGIESFATTPLGTGPSGAIGVLLVPLV